MVSFGLIFEIGFLIALLYLFWGLFKIAPELLKLFFRKTDGIDAENTLEGLTFLSLSFAFYTALLFLPPPETIKAVFLTSILAVMVLWKFEVRYKKARKQ